MEQVIGLKYVLNALLFSFVGLVVLGISFFVLVRGAELLVSA